MKNQTRRRFMSDVGFTAAALGMASPALSAQAPSRPSTPAFRAGQHVEDDWLDQATGSHRIVIDAVSAQGAGAAVLFANNLYEASKTGYKGVDADLSIVIVMRHFATPFAFGDAWWAKYGKGVAGMLQFNDPKTQQPPAANLYNSADYGMALPNMGNTIKAVMARGAKLAICDMATHGIAGALAEATKTTPDAIYKESVDSAFPGQHFVAAGVIGVTRAQERGYALIFAG